MDEKTKEMLKELTTEELQDLVLAFQEKAKTAEKIAAENRQLTIKAFLDGSKTDIDETEEDEEEEEEEEEDLISAAAKRLKNKFKNR